MRSSGAVFTLVRVGNSDSTRPFEEMQSDNRSVTKIELANNNATKEQFNDQQKPESSGQRHHSPGVDRKSLEELLGSNYSCHSASAVHTNAARAPRTAKVTVGSDSIVTSENRTLASAPTSAGTANRNTRAPNVA